VTITDRDRRILLILLPVVLLIAYWFVLLSPKRADLNTARDDQAAAEQQRDAAVALASQLEKARRSFAADYAAVVRLGKAIPAVIDQPSLLVQLDRAANGTHIDLDSVTFGERSAATVATSAAPSTGTTGATGATGPAAAAGGAPAQTAPGQAVESAGNTANQANQAGAAAGGATDTTVTTTAGATPAAAATAPGGLEQVPVTFNFTGTYFDLADFFHRLKRFVYVANNQIFVRGRLIRIDTVSFTPGLPTSGTTDIAATVGGTVFLSPKGDLTGGATAAGPGTQPPPGQTASGRRVRTTASAAGDVK
jgi:Tfp pilus assembly protein PilO